MLSTVAFLHSQLSVALVLMAILVGLLGFYEFLRHRSVGGGFRSAYLLLAGLTLVQCFLGVVQIALGGRPHNLLHVVYGIFAVFFLPGVYFYVNRGDRVREAWLLATACWVVVVAFLRGRATGAG